MTLWFSHFCSDNIAYLRRYAFIVKFEAKYPSPVILVFQKTMFNANRWLKIRIVSCERAFVTPGRNIGKLAAKSKEERTPSAMRPVGKYHNVKFESYLLL